MRSSKAIHGWLRVGVALVAGLALGGCAGYGPGITDVERRLAAGKPREAVARLERIDFAERDAGLRALHEGIVHRVAGDLEASIAAFERATRILGALEAVSLTETAGTLLLREDVTSYSGAVYERVLVHVYQALNYLERGDLEAARVEARGIELGLRRIDNAVGRTPYGGDAFARYLAGLIYEAGGELDNARIAYRDAWLAYRDTGGERVSPSPPTHLGERLARLARRAGVDPQVDGLPQAPAETAREAPRGELFVVVHDGLVPARVDSSLWVQGGPGGEVYRLSVPALRGRGRRARRIVARADGRVAQGQRVEDVAAVARATLSAHVGAVVARSVTRNVVRAQATRRVREEEPVLAAILNILGALGDRADTRSWRTLPAAIELVRLPLAPGTHEVTVTVEWPGGERRYELDGIAIDAGEMVFRSIHRMPREVRPIKRLR